MSPVEQPVEEAKRLLGLADGNRLYVGLVLLLLAIGSSLASLLLFPQQPTVGPAWPLQIAGIVLFGARLCHRNIVNNIREVFRFGNF